MNKRLMIFPVLFAGGAVAFGLRLAQNLTGFEADTGLPVPGNLPGLVLPLFLAALGAGLFLLSRRLPQENPPGPSFPAAFCAPGMVPFLITLSGIFLMALSGLRDFFVSITALGAVSGELPTMAAISLTGSQSPLSTLLLACTALGCALCAFLAVLRCKGTLSGAFPSVFLLVPVVCLVVRLVLVYRLDSVNPVLATYYPGLLSIVFLTLGFFRLSSFAFQAGRTSPLVFYAAVSLVLGLVLLADDVSSSALFSLGGGICLTGFSFLRLTRLSQQPPAA